MRDQNQIVISSTFSQLFLILSFCCRAHLTASEPGENTSKVWKIEGRGGQWIKKVKRGMYCCQSQSLHLTGSLRQCLCFSDRHRFSSRPTGSLRLCFRLTSSLGLCLWPTGSRSQAVLLSQWQSPVVLMAHWWSVSGCAPVHWQTQVFLLAHWWSQTVLLSHWRSRVMLLAHWQSRVMLLAQWQSPQCLSLPLFLQQFSISHWFSPQTYFSFLHLFLGSLWTL